jgi:cobalt-zinc-cadmium efflux system outer membrane protein
LIAATSTSSIALGGELAAPVQAPPTAHSSERVSLEEAIAEAIAGAPDVLAARESLAQASADATTASLFPNPQLTAGTTLQPLPGRTFTQQNPGGPPQYNIDLSQALDPLIFGKRSAAMASAQRSVEVASADFADVQRRRAAAVASAYFDVMEARALLDLARADLADLRRVEEMTRSRVELGGSAAVDLERAKLAVVSAAQDVRSADVAQAAALAGLNAFLGRATVPVRELTATLEVTSPQDVPNLDSVLPAAEQLRPDMASFRRQVARWDAETHSQHAQGLPSLALEVGYLYQKQETLGGPNQNAYEASVSISLPLFDRNQGNVAKAESQARQARYQLDAARAALRSELTQAIATFAAAREGVVADDPDQLTAARSLRDRTEAAYRLGGRTLLEVLDAEHAQRDALRLHVHVHSAYRRALCQLGAASGAAVKNWGND